MTACFLPISCGSPDFVEAILRHYTGSLGAPPGRKLAWRIHEGGRVIGWIGLGEPPYKLAPRRCLGLLDARFLPHTVSCFVYRLEGPRDTSAGDLLRAWHGEAAQTWRAVYGWEPIHWETMIGQGDVNNLGACFKRARYRRIGWTTGRSARRQTGNAHGARAWVDSPPKLVLYRGPLARQQKPRAWSRKEKRNASVRETT